MIMMEAKVYSLIKMGCKEHMDNLIEYGEIYMNSVAQFNERLEVALAKEGLSQENQIVTYYDTSCEECRHVSVYMKPNTYKHQEEIRYVVKTNDDKPLKIRIGSLRDIACISTLSAKVAYKRKIEMV